jgi:ATP-dependent DNA helicase RecG
MQIASPICYWGGDSTCHLADLVKMPTLEDVYRWMQLPSESEALEFKEAANIYDKDKLLQYCNAIANECGGHIVLGVTDKRPRQIKGSQAFSNADELNKLKQLILKELGIRVDATELIAPEGRVLVFDVPSRPRGHPIALNGRYLMRSGESLVSMTPDHLRKIFAEGEVSWFAQPAKSNATADDVIGLLDTQTYFELLSLTYPSSRDGVLDRLSGEGLIRNESGNWIITNLAAILLAKKLDAFSGALARKAPRVIVYDGSNKLKTRNELIGAKGYAVGFAGLVEFVHSSSPQNHYIEETIREDVKMFPKQAIRELIANALIHQDFTESGVSVMIEMYEDRIEISNPGIPTIQVERFIDEYRSRNEPLADLMRRLGICEEKGSGIDKVIFAAEFYQLPAPDFRVGGVRTTAILFAHQEFAKMNREDRTRACYQHCALQYVSNKKMSNQSLRERFKVDEARSATVSLIIKDTKEAGLIKADDAETTSQRYARYVPFWA